MSVIENIIRTAQTGRASTTYKVGEKSTSSGIPFDVKLSLDEDFKNTIIKGVSIFSLGVAAGITAGIAIKKSRR